MPKQLETILLAILTELNQGSTPVSRKSLDYPIAEVFPTTIERRRFFSLLVDRSDAALRSSGMTTTGMRETLRVFENEIDAGVPVTSRNLLAALSSLLGVVSHAILRKKSRTISERMVQRTSLSTIKDGVFPKHPSRHAPAKRAPRPAYRIIRALKGTGREASTPKSRHSSVRIFYATDRKQIEVKPVKFSGLRGTDLTYGTCEVSIPKAHKIGTLESPSLFRLELRPNPEKHVVLTQTLTQDEQEFLETVAASVKISAANEAFIFIHGYNVSFEDAARRTAQIAFDLKFGGAPILYSWASKGTLAGYAADEATVTWSAHHFEKFLTLIVSRTGAKKIHVIAHSMGNRVVCDALKNLSLKPSGKKNQSKMLLQHLVLAAPDIDADTFRQLAEHLRKMSGFITLYASSNDKAINASKRFHSNQSAGSPPMVVVPGVESIDVSTAGADWLLHSYFSDNWPVLSDIHNLLKNDTPAAERFGLERIVNVIGSHYVMRSNR